MAQTTIAGGFLSTDVVSAQTALTSGLVSTDELIISDAGVLKRMDISVLESYIVTNLGDNNIDVAQSTHGFAVGDIIRLTTTNNTYAKAQADSAANAEAIGIVIDVTDTNNFTYSTSGEITVAGAVPNSTTAGDIIYLSPSTAGSVQNSEPSTDGQVSKPIGIITEANNKMVLVPYRGEVLSSGRNNWDVNGSELVLDANGNTSITADTDDQIDIKLSGADDFQFTANSFTALAGSTITSPSFITGNSGTLRFNDGDGSHYTTLAAHATTTTNVAYTLPPADGSSNQVLTTAGNGVLSWTTPSGGAALTGSTDNTLVTVTGANAIAGESTLTYDASGNTNMLQLSNVESATNKHARIQIKVGASSGDPVLEWCVDPDNNVAIWSMGIDNTNEHFYLMNGSQPGQGGVASHIMEWDTTGASHKHRFYTGNGDADEHTFIFFEHADEEHGLSTHTQNGPYAQSDITTKTLGTISQNWHDASHGIVMQGFGEGNYSLGMISWVQTETTTQATNQGAALALLGQRHDGANGSDTFGSSANIVRIGCNRSSGGATKFIFRSDGTGYAETSWTTYSDNRIKTEQAVVPYGLDTIMQLQPKVYNKHVGSIEDGVVTFHDELEESPHREIGFIAQEVKAIIPEVIPSNADENNSWYALDDGKLMAVVVKAIQELNAKVDALGS